MLLIMAVVQVDDVWSLMVSVAMDPTVIFFLSDYFINSKVTAAIDLHCKPHDCSEKLKFSSLCYRFLDILLACCDELQACFFH